MFNTQITQDPLIFNDPSPLPLPEHSLGHMCVVHGFKQFIYLFDALGVHYLGGKTIHLISIIFF